MTSDPDFLAMTSYQGILSTVCLAGLPDSASMIANSADFTQFSATFFQISHIKSQMLPLRPTWGLRNKYFSQDRESKVQYSYNGCPILQTGLPILCTLQINISIIKTIHTNSMARLFLQLWVLLFPNLEYCFEFKKNYDFYIICCS